LFLIWRRKRFKMRSGGYRREKKTNVPSPEGTLEP